MSTTTTTTEAPASTTLSGAQIQPYLFFGGRCDEAIAFYERALGAKLGMLMRFKDAPPPAPGESTEGCTGPISPEHVMHAEIRIGDAVMFASDGCGEESGFQGFSLSLAVKKTSEAERVFASLADEGKVLQPLTPTFFSPAFGMVQDKFGVTWMVIVPKE